MPAMMVKKSRRGRFLWVAVAAVLSGGSVRGQQQVVEPSSIDIQGYVREVGPLRPFAWRTSVDFQYAAPGDAGPEIGSSAFFGRLSAEAAIKRALEDQPTPANLAAWALVQLLRVKPDEAIFYLEQARLKGEDSPQVLNDLSVAHALRYSQERRGTDFVEAIESCEAALEMNPTFQPALFNRALLLSAVHLDSAGLRSWNGYLDADPASPWRDEAEVELGKLRGGLAGGHQGGEGSVAPADPSLLVARSPQKAREYGEEQALPEWAEAILAGDKRRAGEILDRLERLGDLLERRNSETGIADEVRLIRSLAATGAGEQELAKAHADLALGRIRYAGGDFEGAKPALESAAVGFSNQGSPSQLTARLYLARCLFQKNDYSGAIGLLNTLAAAVDSKRRGSLAAAIEGTLGISHAIGSRYATGLSHYRRAEALYERLGESNNRLRTLNRSAELLSYLGRWDETWNTYLDCLSEATHVERARSRREIYQGAAVAALHAGALHWALHLQEESVELARRSKNAGDIASSLGWRAGLLLQLGRRDDARSDLLEAEVYIDQFPKGPLQNAYRAETLFALGELESAEDPEVGIVRLTEALRLFEKTSFDARLPAVLQARAHCLERMGKTDLAVQSLERSLDLIERSRNQMGYPPFRISFLDEQRTAFEALVEIEFAAGDTTKAFATAERAKARALIDQLNRKFPAEGLSTLDASGLLPFLRKGEVLVDYFLTTENLFVWRLSEEGVGGWRLPSKDLARLWEQFKLAIEYRSEPLLGSALEAFHLRLAQPVFHDIPAGTRVIVATDSFLGALPFAALHAPEGGRFLVQDYPLAVLPSASLLPFIRRRTVEGNSTRPGLLAIGNPRFPRDTFPNLPDLPGAEEEAKRAAPLYSRSSLLVAGEATKDEFLKRFGRFEVVLFAGHAVVNSERPADSLLLFSPSPSDDEPGLLRVSELANLSAVGTRLAILSACRTAGGPVSRGEGALAVYRPLLAAGVPAVVASLWDLGDRSASKLFQTFHRSVSEGGDPVSALRGAQIEALRAPGASIFDWGGLQLFGF